MNTAIRLVEAGLVRDGLVRSGIRRLCAQRLASERAGGDARQAAILASLAGSPVAPLPEKANEQHDEMPPEFMALAVERVASHARSLSSRGPLR